MKNIFRSPIIQLLIIKKSIFFLCAFSVIFYVYFLYFYKPSISVMNFNGMIKHHEKLSPCNCRSVSHRLPKTNIFFLKTHKAGSSTVQNIIMRFGLRRSLNFLLPKEGSYFGYTIPFDRSDLEKQFIPLDKKFDIFTHHCRYNQKISEFLHPDTIKVTILRNPAQLCESAFGYFNLQKFYNYTFAELLASLPHGVKLPISSKRKIQGHNQMSRDLGFEKEYYNNETAIRNFIRYIDAEFDLVMIQEYFEASMVLLANLMGWPLHYVSFIPLNIRNQSRKYNLTSADKFKLYQFNQADSKLYDYFLKKFRACLIKYGRKRIIEDVQKLQILNQDLRKRCILKESFTGTKVKYILRNNSDWDCIYSTKEEPYFSNELRAIQSKRLELIKKLQNFIDEE